ncbi:uncharacterized protein PAE49_012511 [Odontesthes bonariensis]
MAARGPAAFLNIIAKGSIAISKSRELPQYYLCEEEIPVNLEKDSSLDQEEPEPPQIKEEQVEVCTSHEEQQLLLKQETDNLTVTLTYEESDRSEAEPTNVQLQDQSQDQEGSGRESTGNAELRPKKRHHSNDGDNSSMSESHRNTAKADLSQQYVCKEEEILTDQQFFNHESNSSLDQQEPEPPQFKEELEERCTSQEEEWLELKQETDILSVTPTYEESELTSDQLLSQNSSVAERQEMEENLRDEESESTQNAKLKPNKRRKRNINHSNDVINESQFNADTGDQAVKCEVCGKAFMSYSELRAHCRMHTDVRSQLPVVTNIMEPETKKGARKKCAGKKKEKVEYDTGKRCVAWGCSNTCAMKGISTFLFPKDKAQSKAWSDGVKKIRADWMEPTKYSVLCSEHFTRDCFEEGPLMRAALGIDTKRPLQLKKGVVPSIFPKPQTITQPHAEPSGSRSAYAKRERKRKIDGMLSAQQEGMESSSLASFRGLHGQSDWHRHRYWHNTDRHSGAIQ